MVKTKILVVVDEGIIAKDLRNLDSLGALWEMELVDMIEHDKVTSYKLSERGKSGIDEVEPPSIFYDWARRREG